MLKTMRVLVVTLAVAMAFAPRSGMAGSVWKIGIGYPDVGEIHQQAGFNTSFGNPVISVESSDGVSYDQIKLPPRGITFPLQLQSECSPNSLDSKVVVGVGDFSKTIVSGWGGSLFHGLVDGEYYELDTPYIAPSLAGAATPQAACNQHVSQYESQGLPRWEVLQEGFAIPYSGAYKPYIKVTCGKYVKKHKQRDFSMTAWVWCKPSPLAKEPPAEGPHRLEVPFEIKDVDIKVQPSRVSTTCPTKIHVTATMTAIGKGTAKFRMVHNGGAGPVRSVQFPHGGTKSDTADFEIGSTSGGPSLTVETSGGGGAAGGLKQAEQPNQHTGYFEIQLVGTPGVQKSGQAFYSVTCKPKSTIPAGPGQLAPGGKPTGKPGIPTIQQPSAGSGFCGAVPLQVSGSGNSTGTELRFQYHTPNCGTSETCWNTTPLTGFDQFGQPSLNTTIPRSTFPSKGEWRVRARGTHGSSNSDWSGWDQFRVKRNNECG